MSKNFGSFSIPYPVFTGRLASKTRVILLVRKGLLRKLAFWAVPFGSITPPGRDRDFEYPSGIAHFLEHQLFREEDGSSISDRFAALGVQDNAFTYFDTTAYHFRSTDNFAQSLKLLMEFTASSHFSEESVAQEKEVITQELLMYRDHPGSVLELNLRKALYLGHPLAEEIGGTEEGIADITATLLQEVHQVHYSPERAVLVVIADLTPNELESMLGEAPGTLSPLGIPGAENALFSGAPVYQGKVAGGMPAKSEIIATMPVARPMLSIGFKDANPATDALGLLKKQIESDMLLDLIFAKSGDAYWELYRAGLINNTFGYGFHSSELFAYARIGGECHDPKLLQEALLNLLSDSAKNAITSGGIERIKRKYLGEYITGYEGFEDLAFDLVQAVFCGVDLRDIPDIIMQIGQEDIHRRMDSLFSPKQMGVAQVIPG